MRLLLLVFMLATPGGCSLLLRLGLSGERRLHLTRLVSYPVHDLLGNPHLSGDSLYGHMDVLELSFHGSGSYWRHRGRMRLLPDGVGSRERFTFVFPPPFFFSPFSLASCFPLL